MLFNTIVALTLATFGAATAAPEEHEHEARAVWLAKIYDRENFQGGSITFYDSQSGHCKNIPPSFRRGPQSINIDTREGDYCYLYKRRNCNGHRSHRITRDDRNLGYPGDSWDSAKCFRGHH